MCWSVSSSVTEEFKQSSWLTGTVSILQVTVKWLQSFWSTLHLLFAHSFLEHRHVLFLLFVTFTEQVCICKQSHTSADFFLCLSVAHVVWIDTLHLSEYVLWILTSFLFLPSQHIKHFSGYKIKNKTRLAQQCRCTVKIELNKKLKSEQVHFKPKKKWN